MRAFENLACTVAGVCRSRIFRWLIALPVGAAMIGTYLMVIKVVRLQPDYVVSVNAGTVTGTVSPLLFGSNFVWHLGDQILNDATHPESGFRDDVVQLSSAAGVSILLFPGGGSSETYRWRDAVGPVADRNHVDMGGGNFETPYVGTDEFMEFCGRIGCTHQIMVVNYCTGTPQEAANWVEYCNAPAPAVPNPSWTADSYQADEAAPPGYFAWLRKQFGHAAPYHIEYWQIGNEVFCRTELRPDMSPESYGNAVNEFSAAMKAVDPEIKIGAVAVDVAGHEDWNERLLAVAAPGIDFMAPHYGNSLLRLVFDFMCRSSTSTRTVSFQSGGSYTFSVTACGYLRAYGEPLDEQGVCPQLEFSIDGQPVATWDVSKLAKYEVTRSVTAGSHQLSVRFTNDYCSPDKSVDRNVHMYGVTMRSSVVGETNIWYPNDAEQQLLFNDGNLVAASVHHTKSLISQYSPNKPISIMVTEGCMAYNDEGSSRYCKYPQDEVTHSLRLKGALWQAGLLNTLIREQIAEQGRWVLFDPGYYGDIREPSYTVAGKPLVAPSYYTMKMYAQLGGGRLVDTVVKCRSYQWPEGQPVPPMWDGTNASESLPKPENVPYLDVVSVRSADGRYLRIVVTNRSRVSAKTQVQITGFRPYASADVSTLAAWSLAEHPERIVGNRDPELEAWNDTKALDRSTVQPDDVSMRSSRITYASVKFTYTFRPYSITTLVLRKR